MANILIVGPHPDDQELGMGGTIARLAVEGHKVVLLDLTDGEPTPHGDSATRQREAQAALDALQPTEAERAAGAQPILRTMLGGQWGAGLTNRQIEHSLEARHRVAGVIRAHQINVLFVPHPQDAHPDHLAATRICIDARFDAKLTKVAMPGDHGQPPIHPKWLFYYFATHLRVVPQPHFIIDTTPYIDRKQAAIMAYRSQFVANARNRSVPDWIRSMDGYIGSRIGVPFGEAFATPEPLGLTGFGGLAL